MRPRGFRGGDWYTPHGSFYFRFIAPYQGNLSYQPEVVLPAIQHGLRAFVVLTAWEDLARQWVDTPQSTPIIGFTPHVQVEVVAADWQTRTLLLSECRIVRQLRF